MGSRTVPQPIDLWQRYVMAIEDVTNRLERITRALEQASVPYALVGGQAVALWVASRDPAAVRTTKDIDILLRPEDLPKALEAARSVGMEYFEVLGVGMFLEQDNPDPRQGVHLVWAGQKVRPQYPLPAPVIEDRVTITPGKTVVTLAALVTMKLVSNRELDRVHLRDMIGVGLIDRELLQQVPKELAARLEAMLAEPRGEHMGC